jgi:hypothetical protein
MMKEFISNRDLNIDFHSNLPAFVFYFNDHHIYLINDKDVRQGDCVQRGSARQLEVDAQAR